MKIFVVRGSTGEYSDRIEWVVKAFLDENKAQSLVLKATEAANIIDNDRESEFSVPDGVKNVYDPDMKMDYTGTSYYYEEVDLEE